MTTKPQTHKDECFNEVRFEDENDQEEIFIHAQKDMDIKVLNNREKRVDDDLDGLAERLVRIADRRRRMMGQFDDEYHIDFDDGFSWTVPYEVGAVLMARKAQGLPVPEIDHPIFELPTARFELASGPVAHYQDIYARFIREA